MNTSVDKDDDFERVEDQEPSTWRRFKKVMSLAIPLSLTNVIWVLQFCFNIYFIGRRNDKELVAGVGLGNMTSNILAASIMFGMNGSINTLVSQAYGQEDLHLCGVYLNRGRLLILGYFALVALPMAFTKEILIALGQHEQVSAYAGQYVLGTMPAFLIMSLEDAQIQHMVSLGITKVSVVAQICGNVAHFFCCYYFIAIKELDIEGIAISMAISNSISFTINFVYCLYHEELKQTQFFPGWETFTNLNEQLRLGVHSALLLCLEWWAFELMILITGHIGVNEQTSQIIFFNIIMFIYNVIMGIREPTGFLMGKAIGEGNEIEARTWFYLSLKIAFCESCLQNIFIYYFFDNIFSIFTQNEEILATSRQVAWLVILNNVADVIQGFLKGPVTALGIQGKVGYLNFIGYYLINLPLCYLFAFSLGFGYLGIWIAIGITQLFIVCSFMLTIERYDWQEAVRKAKERHDKEEKQG